MLGFTDGGVVNCGDGRKDDFRDGDVLECRCGDLFDCPDGPTVINSG